jgi:glycosyltransferase involved in cell wall biosynthesis
MASFMEFVSVILPTYNRAQLIARSIRSVLSQTFESFELIVVDDGSTDDTEDLVGEFRDDRIKYVKMSGRNGASAARNTGIRIATADLIAYQDSDDEWMSTKLYEQLLKFAEQPEVGVVYSDMLRVTKSGECSLLSAPEFESGILDATTGRYRVQDIGIGSCLVRRKAFDDVGLFNEDLPALEDLELLIRISQKWKMIKISRALVKYYETAGLTLDFPRLAKARRMLIDLYASQWTANKLMLARELVEIDGLEKMTAAR